MLNGIEEVLFVVFQVVRIRVINPSPSPYLSGRIWCCEAPVRGGVKGSLHHSWVRCTCSGIVIIYIIWIRGSGGDDVKHRSLVASLMVMEAAVKLFLSGFW